MIKFWKHVDFLIPDEDKIQNIMSDDEADERSKRSMNALSKLQMQGVKK